MSATVTQWFSGDPVKVGAWETSLPKQVAQTREFQYWDGFHWCRTMGTPQDAFDRRGDPSFFHHVQWRGLASQPDSQEKEA